MSQDQSARDWARNKIRDAGLRATPARVATLLALRDAEAPLSHAQVSACLAELRFDRATVFRNLNDMVAADLVRRSELGDHVWRFELVAEDEQSHRSHPHFVCIDCGSISCVQDIELTKKSKAATKSLGEITEILLRGHCPECA
ncbi:MAG: transcriptional repressor [Planctomycetota bacterium]